MSVVSDESYEELRGYGYIEEWLQRPCTLEEARQIGDGFIEFYMLLWELDMEDNIQGQEDNYDM